MKSYLLTLLFIIILGIHGMQIEVKQNWREILKNLNLQHFTEKFEAFGYDYAGDYKYLSNEDLKVVGFQDKDIENWRKEYPEDWKTILRQLHLEKFIEPIRAKKGEHVELDFLDAEKLREFGFKGGHLKRFRRRFPNLYEDYLGEKLLWPQELWKDVLMELDLDQFIKKFADYGYTSIFQYPELTNDDLKDQDFTQEDLKKWRTKYTNPDEIYYKQHYFLQHMNMLQYENDLRQKGEMEDFNMMKFFPFLTDQNLNTMLGEGIKDGHLQRWRLYFSNPRWEGILKNLQLHEFAYRFMELGYDYAPQYPDLTDADLTVIGFEDKHIKSWRSKYANSTELNSFQSGMRSLFIAMQQSLSANGYPEHKNFTNIENEKDLIEKLREYEYEEDGFQKIKLPGFLKKFGGLNNVDTEEWDGHKCKQMIVLLAYFYNINIQLHFISPNDQDFNVNAAKEGMKQFNISLSYNGEDKLIRVYEVEDWLHWLQSLHLDNFRQNISKCKKIMEGGDIDEDEGFWGCDTLDDEENFELRKLGADSLRQIGFKAGHLKRWRKVFPNEDENSIWIDILIELDLSQFKHEFQRYFDEYEYEYESEEQFKALRVTFKDLENLGFKEHHLKKWKSKYDIHEEDDAEEDEAKEEIAEEDEAKEENVEGDDQDNRCTKK